MSSPKDGGWKFNWLSVVPAQTNDWRRRRHEIRALTWLRDNGRRTRLNESRRPGRPA